MISPLATIDVRYPAIADSATVRDYCRIEGYDVKIGERAWLDYYAFIGGGSCHDPLSRLVMGDDCHMGMWSVINTAREVTIGNEVGIGIRTSIFTHGAYLSALDGFPYKFAPVMIGDRVWLPNAIVSPGVTIGDDVVVLPNSVVTQDIPSGSLAAGTPCKVIETNAFPKTLTADERREIVAQVEIDAALIETFGEREPGSALENQFRRYGVRGRNGTV